MKNDSSLYLTAELLALYETQYQNVAELQSVEKKADFYSRENLENQ